MNPTSVAPAAFAQPTPSELALSGSWTALGTGGLDLGKLAEVKPPAQAEVVVDGAGVEVLDTIGARIHDAARDFLDQLWSELLAP